MYLATCLIKIFIGLEDSVLKCNVVYCTVRYSSQHMALFTLAGCEWMANSSLMDANVINYNNHAFNRYENVYTCCSLFKFFETSQLGYSHLIKKQLWISKIELNFHF